MLTPDGRMTLTDTNLIIDAPGRKEILPISGEKAFLMELKIKFGIIVDTST
jgi:hypothetical protein